MKSNYVNDASQTKIEGSEILCERGITQEYFNLSTGERRKEFWREITVNKYQDLKGYIYTYGKLGWFCVNPMNPNIIS